MTPNEIRQTLSKKLLLSVVSAALQKLPSVPGVESYDIERCLPENAFVYKPTNTMGLLVDRVYVELPEEPTMEQLDHALIDLLLDPESAIAPTVESLATKMATAISSTYGALRDSVIPAAEDICDTINARLGQESALGGEVKDTSVVLFDWGVLNDPVFVGQAITLAKSKASVFDEDAPLRPHVVNTLFTQAGKSLPENRIVGEERVAIEALLKEELGDAYRDIGQLSSFYTSPEGFRSFYSNMRPQFHRASEVTQASDTIQNLHLIGEKLYEISRREGTPASEAFRTNLATGSEALSLLAATLHAARKVFYSDALILSGTFDGDHLSTLVLNTDRKMAADNKAISADDCSAVALTLSSEKVNIGDRGLSLETVEKEKDRAVKNVASLEEMRLKSRLGQDARTYYGVVENAISKQISEMVKVFKPKLRGRNLGEEIHRIAVSAVNNEGNTFDAVTRLGVSLLHNPAMETMLASMESVTGEEPGDPRCEIFTKFALHTLLAVPLLEKTH